MPSDNVAAIDTGTTLIGGPSAAVQAIYAQIPGSQQLSGNLAGFYGFPCETNVSVNFSFGGKSWPISPDDMNVGRVSSGSDICAGGIFDLTAGSSIPTGGGNPDWVVGDAFLKNVYSVFRYQPAGVGFAELSNAAGGSSGTPSGNGSKNSGSGRAQSAALARFGISSVIFLMAASFLF